MNNNTFREFKNKVHEKKNHKSTNDKRVQCAVCVQREAHDIGITRHSRGCFVF